MTTQFAQKNAEMLKIPHQTRDSYFSNFKIRQSFSTAFTVNRPIRARGVYENENEKLYRYCCALPIEKVQGESGNANYVKRCINNPKRKNQNVICSKQCHYYSTGNMDAATALEQLDLRPITRRYSKNIAENLLFGKGCKLEQNVNKFETRTAGMFYVMRSCGIWLSHLEKYTAESLSMVFLSLIDFFTAEPDQQQLTRIVYDRACDLDPYFQRLCREGNTVAERYATLRYIVDIFHCERHTQPKCVLGNEECRYHPDLPQFNDIRKMNMEICEQSFHLLNPLKHITRNMTYAKRLCFLKIVDNDFNTRLELKQMHE